MRAEDAMPLGIIPFVPFLGFSDAPPTGNTDPSAAGAQSVPMPPWDVPFTGGARSQMVATLQTLLRQRGYGLRVDGIVGPETQLAVEQAFNVLATSRSQQARTIGAPGPAGLSVAQIISALQTGYAYIASVSPAPVAVSVPSEPDGRISMTPAEAAAMDRKIQGGGAGWLPWALGIAGVGLVGWAWLGGGRR